MRTARPLFEGRTVPRRLSELSDTDYDGDDDDDDENGKPKKPPILRVRATCAYARPPPKKNTPTGDEVGGLIELKKI